MEETAQDTLPAVRGVILSSGRSGKKNRYFGGCIVLTYGLDCPFGSQKTL
jgi:hypothetical protein